MVTSLQSDIDSTSKWVTQSGLRLNAAKTKFILFSTPSTLCLILYGIAITQDESVKYLGVIYIPFKNQSWGKHITSV